MADKTNSPEYKTDFLFNVRDFGASSDNPDNTPAFQKAIDQCAGAGGGIVLVPPGNYALGMTELRDFVELRIERGALLRSILQPVPDPLKKAKEPTCNSRRFLLGGVNIRHAAITGEGIIDGCGTDLFWDIDPTKEYPIFGQRWWPKLHRPKGLIHFRESSNIIISGVTIKNPPAYTIWTLGCENLQIKHITIDTPLESPNTDGLDIDCCSNVKIEGCCISTGDDAIAIKSDINVLGYDRPCENIIVTGCILKTSSCGIRLGYEGDGEIRNCIFSNCVIYDSMIGISLMSVLDADNQRGTIIQKGPKINDVIFSDLVIDALQTFNFQHLKCSQGQLIGKIDRISFHNITASAKRGSYMGGMEDQPIGQLNFSHVSMRLSGPMGKDFLNQVPDPYPIWNDLAYYGLPWAYFVRNVEKVHFSNCTVSLTNQAIGDWQNEPLKTVNVKHCRQEIDFEE
jgi:polygalacturonase